MLGRLLPRESCGCRCRCRELPRGRSHLDSALSSHATAIRTRSETSQLSQHRSALHAEPTAVLALPAPSGSAGALLAHVRPALLAFPKAPGRSPWPPYMRHACCSHARQRGRRSGTHKPLWGQLLWLAPRFSSAADSFLLGTLSFIARARASPLLLYCHFACALTGSLDASHGWDRLLRMLQGSTCTSPSHRQRFFDASRIVKSCCEVFSAQITSVSISSNGPKISLRAVGGCSRALAKCVAAAG